MAIDSVVQVLLLMTCAWLFAFDRRHPLWLRAVFASHGAWWCAAFQYALRLSRTSRAFAPIETNPGWQLWYGLLAIGVAIAAASLFAYRGPKRVLLLHLPSALFGFVLWFDGAIAITHDGP